MKTKKIYLSAAGVLAVAALVGIDQLTKYLAHRFLAGSAGIPVIPGIFELFYLENRGAAFGMLSNRQWFFVAVALLMILAAFYVYLRTPRERHYGFMRGICVLISAGAAGNMLDRLLHRYVIDFLYVSAIDFPVFNIADCYVCVGVFLALAALFTVYRDDDFTFLFPGRRAGGNHHAGE